MLVQILHAGRRVSHHPTVGADHLVRGLHRQAIRRRYHVLCQPGTSKGMVLSSMRDAAWWQILGGGVFFFFPQYIVAQGGLDSRSSVSRPIKAERRAS